MRRRSLGILIRTIGICCEELLLVDLLCDKLQYDRIPKTSPSLRHDSLRFTQVRQHLILPTPTAAQVDRNPRALASYLTSCKRALKPSIETGVEAETSWSKESKQHLCFPLCCSYNPLNPATV